MNFLFYFFLICQSLNFSFILERNVLLDIIFLFGSYFHSVLQNISSYFLLLEKFLQTNLIILKEFLCMLWGAFLLLLSIFVIYNIRQLDYTVSWGLLKLILVELYGFLEFVSPFLSLGLGNFLPLFLQISSLLLSLPSSCRTPVMHMLFSLMVSHK